MSKAAKLLKAMQSKNARTNKVKNKSESLLTLVPSTFSVQQIPRK